MMDIKEIQLQWKLYKKETVIDSEQHKSIIRKFEKHSLYSSFIDNSLGADLADMQLLYNFNKEVLLLLYIVDTYGKYAWVVPLKDKKCIKITNAFQKHLGESGHKPNKIWINIDQ